MSITKIDNVHRDFFLGFIRLHILYHALQAPVYGLDLIRELEKHGYHLSPGTLYPILHGLERDGYLVAFKQVVERKMRKYYRATERGEEALQAALDKSYELIHELDLKRTGNQRDMKQFQTRKVIYAILTGFGIAVAIALVWRWLSRKKQLPCPSWLSWLLISPIVEPFWGTKTQLEKIGLQSGEQCLDVGCGPGRLSIPATLKLGPLGNVVAMDIQPGMIRQLKQNVLKNGVNNLIPHLGDITTDTSLASNNFNRAWMVTVLGEIPDQFAALSNIFRMLKPGGTLSITEMFPDPHFQTHSKVLRLCQSVGFVPQDYFGHSLSFTQNFSKPT